MVFGSILVVGASIAGFRAAEALRRLGYQGRLTILGEEPGLPYQRPALSKQYLASKWSDELVGLRTANGLNAELRLGERAVSLDMRNRQVRTSHGAAVDFDGLVIATGSQPRQLPWMDGIQGAHSLRTMDDCLAIRKSLGADRDPVAVVGAGFIGLEAAATCRLLGHPVTLLDALARPMCRVVGDVLAEYLLELHRRNGVDVRTGVRVASVEGGDPLHGIVLEDGERVPATVAIVGVGVEPCVDWLADSGLPLADGVVCDSTCAVVGVDGVVAAGDVARWYHPMYGRDIRVEHWDNAIRQAQAAASSLLNGPGGPPYQPLPFFWSDQYATRLQVVGLPDRADDFRIIEGSLAEDRFVGHFIRNGRVTAAALLNSAAHLGEARKLVERELMTGV